MSKTWPAMETIPLVYLKEGETMQIGLLYYRLERFTYPSDEKPSLDEYIDLHLVRDTDYPAKYEKFNFLSAVVRMSKYSTVRRIVATRKPSEVEA